MIRLILCILIALGATIARTQDFSGVPSANQVFAGPSSGSPAPGSFRALTTGDLPSPFTSGTRSGNTSEFATVSGALTNGNCLKIDSSGNLLDAGAPCGGGAGSSTIQNYLAGLTISNDNSGSNITNDIAVAAGVATDSTNIDFLTVASAINQKHTNVAWAVGSNAGCLDTGSVGNSTYFVFIIKRTDTQVVDVLCSLSPTAPTMPTDYTEKRRIGAVLRASAAIVLFTQDGNDFTLLAPTAEQNGTNPTNTSAFTVTLTGIPVGVRVLWRGSCTLNVTGAYTIMLISDLAINDTAPSNLFASVSSTPISGGATANASTCSAYTNSAGQFRGRVSARDSNTFYYLSSFGWRDTRGQ